MPELLTESPTLLTSRFNAHLTFNVLSMVQGYIMEKDPEGAASRSAEPMESGIPQPFRGTWGSAEGCDPANESDFLVVVDATSLTYYEAQCKLRTVAVTDADRFSGRFDCTEYEHKWIQDVSMKLDNGKLTHEWAGRKPDSRFRCR